MMGNSVQSIPVLNATQIEHQLPECAFGYHGLEQAVRRSRWKPQDRRSIPKPTLNLATTRQSSFQCLRHTPSAEMITAGKCVFSRYTDSAGAVTIFL